MALKVKQERFAILWFQGQGRVEDWATELDVEERTLYRWKNDPEIRNYVLELIGQAKLDALAVYARNAVRAAQTTLLYLQADPVYDKNDKGKVVGHRLHYPKQARLAAADIHQSLDIPVKGPQGTGQANAPAVMILLPEKDKLTDEPEALTLEDMAEDEDMNGNGSIPETEEESADST